MRDTIASPDRAVRKSIRLAEVWEALLFTIGSYPDFASDMQGGACFTRGRGWTFKLRHHHDVRQPVSGPAAEPRNDPIAEARTNRDWCEEVEEFGFWLHGVTVASQHIYGSAEGDSQVENR